MAILTNVYGEIGVFILSNPGQFGCFLEIFVISKICTVKGQDSIDFGGRCDGNITPFHESNFITNFKSRSVLFLEKNVLTVEHSFSSKALVLLMKRMSLSSDLIFDVVENKPGLLILSDEDISCRNWVDDILVIGPKLIPLHQIGIL